MNSVNSKDQPLDRRDTTSAQLGPFLSIDSDPLAILSKVENPEETATVKILRALYLSVGKKGMAILITFVALAQSILLTVLLNYLIGFDAQEIGKDLLIATIIPLIIAPPIYLFYAKLTDYLLVLENKLHSQANYDSLTKAPNRRWIIDRYNQAASFAANTGMKFGVLMIDVDHFKKINDKHGHKGGDHVLQSMVQFLAERIRKTDRFGRYGGEEFLMLTNDQKTDELHNTAETLRRELNETVFELDNQMIKISVSIGAAIHKVSYLNDAIDDTLGRADAALYRAKNSGRNKVEIDTESGDSAIQLRSGYEGIQHVS